MKSEKKEEEKKNDEKKDEDKIDEEEVDLETIEDEEEEKKSSVKRELHVEKLAKQFGEARGYHLRKDKNGTVFIGKNDKDKVNLHHAEVRGGTFAELLGAQILGIAATKGCCTKCQKTFEKQLHLVCFARQRQDRYNEFRNRRAKKEETRIPTIDEVLGKQQLKRHVVGGAGMCFFLSAVVILGSGAANDLRKGLGKWLEKANDNELTTLFDAEKTDILKKLKCDSLGKYAEHLGTDADTWGYSVTVAALAKWKKLRLIVLVWNEEAVDEHGDPIGRISKTEVYGPNDGTPACVINTRPLYFDDHFEPVVPGDDKLAGRTDAIAAHYARKNW